MENQGCTGREVPVKKGFGVSEDGMMCAESSCPYVENHKKVVCDNGKAVF